jgi:hypothetical protein
VVARRRRPTLDAVDGAGAAGAARPAPARDVELAGAQVTVRAPEDFDGGSTVDGPILVAEVDSTHYVPSGWVARLGQGGSVVAERAA